MPKLVKRKIKHQTKKSITKNAKNKKPNLKKIEKDFLQTPQKLAKHVAKELKVHQKDEKKLRKAIQKISNALKSGEKKIKTVSAKTPSKASRKQLNTAKKLQQSAMKSHGKLNKNLDAACQIIDVLSAKHARLVALGNHLSQFDKEWKSNSKAATTTKANKKSKSKMVDNVEDLPKQDDAQDIDFDADAPLVRTS